MMAIQNPVLRGFNPDPSICRAGEDYYIATSTFEWFPGVQLHHSRDLVNWHLVHRPLNRLSQLDMKGNPNSGGIWAPDLSYHDGKFWLVYTDVKVVNGIWKDCLNYLVTCDTIDGEWSEPILLNGVGFDASLFHDEDGRKYLLNMYWDHRMYHHPFYGISLQEYDHEKQQLIGEPQIIYKGTDLRYTEGPHLYRVNDYYYLFVAEGGTTYQHAETVARSRELFGPYETQPDYPMLSAWQDPRHPLQKCGHASLLHTHTDEWYLAHLTGRPLPNDTLPILDNRGYCPLGRETALQQIEWVDGWPMVVGGKQGKVEVPAPQMEPVLWEQDYPEHDDFDSTELNIHFQTLRIPLTKDIACLESRPGYLRLYGRESLSSLFTQAYVARRWQAFSFDAATAIDFRPTTFQQGAGLTCYYNTENWSTLQITWHEKYGRVLDLLICDNGQFSQPFGRKPIPVPEEAELVHIKVEVRVQQYHYSYSFDGQHWHTVPVELECYKLSDDYVQGGGFFTGAFVGMNCIDMGGRRRHADFDYFMYKELEG